MRTRLPIALLGLLLLVGCDRTEKADFHYKVLNKVYTQGQLVNSGEIDRFGAVVKTRIDPKFEVYFKGVESGREYPPLLVSESAFRNFVQGGVYDRAALNSAKH